MLAPELGVDLTKAETAQISSEFNKLEEDDRLESVHRRYEAILVAMIKRFGENSGTRRQSVRCPRI